MRFIFKNSIILCALAYFTWYNYGSDQSDTDLIIPYRVYSERTGEETKERTWELRIENDLHYVTSVLESNRYETITNPKGDTLEWSAKEEDFSSVGIREGCKIKLDVKTSGESTAHEFEVGDQLWFQSINYSLEIFAASDQEEIRFVTILPKKHELYGMKAEKKGLESIRINNEEVSALRVRVRLTGWRSGMWKCDYWFDANDKKYIAYKGRNGPPGTPVTYIDLLKRSED